MTTETFSLPRPGATITYDVHRPTPGPANDQYPPLLIVGSPMDAEGFALLAAQLTDRLVLTYDPRGTGRSTLLEPVEELTPADHAHDLAAVLDAAGVTTADVFATSGGAVNALALVAAYPGRVRTLIAHEPPLAAYLDPDGAEMEDTARAIHRTYEADGLGPAMAKFIVLVSHQGPLPPGFAAQPGPDPSTFGFPADDDGDRQHPLVGLNLVTCTTYRPDLDRVRAGVERLVVAVGDESADELAGRAGTGLAAAAGVPVTRFPSHHTGFTNSPFSPPGQPEAFASALRQVLDG